MWVLGPALSLGDLWLKSQGEAFRWNLPIRKEPAPPGFGSP